MQSVNVWILLVAITVSLFQGGTTYDIVGDLSALQDQYQTLLTEYESSDSAHDTGIATLLEKLDILQYSIPSHPNNVTLEWFTPPIDFLSNPPLRITIVVSSFEGMFLNSGIGTFYSSLTDFLISAGHAVTILYTDTQASDTPAFAKWSAQLARRGAKAVRLGAFPIHLRLSTLAQRSYQVYEYLKSRQTEFDAVHFPDWEGPGYYSMLAKKDGLAFLNKVFIVGIHGPWRWVKAANHPNSRISSSLQTAEDMETDWMERKSVEMSDMVWTPSSDIISWLKQQGWAIPLPIYQMPYLPGREIAQIKINFKDVEVDESESINELVFFGRLETRKGVELFADALDRLAVTRPEFAGTKITFLGRSANIGNQTASSYINDRYVKGAWPFKLVFVSHKDRKAALEYLRESSRIAVIPSLVDNTPYTVYECLFANIPFIASNISSIAALVDPADRDDALFEVSSISLARKLENVLDNGARAIKSTLLLSQIEAAWAGFYAAAYNKITEQKAQKPVENTLEPLVSVCIIHYNRPQFLQLALESVEAQTYANFEVVLVDDGSTTQAAREYLETLAPKFAIKGWQLILSTNQYLGAARNKAAAHARGEYILFLDDDNLLSPTLLSTYIAVAARTRADVLTAGHDVFEGNGKVDMNANVVGRWVPLGASPLVGLFKNCFGDANFFIKKTVFEELNGFTEDRGVGQEDHEFLAKAVLDGFSLLVIPEPLLAYRMHNQSEQMLYTTDSLKNALRAHRPYRRLMEESGIEINEKGLTTTPQKPTHNAESLKLLAYSRAYSRQTSSSCNLTVTSVTPATIQARTSVTLTFTTSARDCEISNLRLGDQYICDLVGVAAFSFSCVTQPIPIPGNYPVYLQYTVEPNYRDTLTRVSVLASPNPDGATSAVFTLAVFREAGLFAQDELLDRVSAQTPGAPISSYSMLARTTTSVGAKRAVDSEELHTTTIMVTNLKPTAAQAYQTLSSAINANRSCLLPYRFSSLQLNAICNSQGVCSCSPYFTGPGCTTPATCPNDCSGHGSCTNGPNGKLCQCDAGWLGTDCSVGTCPNNCNGHGTCNVERGAGNATCVCNLGWEGAACDEPNCPGNCNGNACQNKICICPAGVTTPDCSILGEGETDGGSGRIVNPTAAGDDTYDRDVFIGILFMFLVLIVVAGAFVYHAYQRKKNLQQQDDD